MLLTALCLATIEDSPRLKSLSGKVKCNCGCGEVLSECTHKECQRKPALRAELSDAISRGKSDDQILSQMAATYGGDILLTPPFHGFNELLWIVPVGVGLLATGATFMVQRKRRKAFPNPQPRS